MISLSPKRYGVLQVSRPAFGGEGFIAAASETARYVLDQRTIGSITRQQSDGRYFSKDIKADNFRVSPDDELELVLLHRGLQQGPARYYHVQQTADLLETVDLDDDPKAPISEEEHSYKNVLREMCRRIATDFELENNSVYFDRVEELKLKNTTNKEKGRTYGLFPKRGDMATLAAEVTAQYCELSLNHVNPNLYAVDHSYGVDKQGIAVPFIHVPQASRDQHESLLVAWNEQIAGLPDKVVNLSLSDVTIVGKL